MGRELVPICRPEDLQGPHAIRTPQDLLRHPLLFHTHYPGNWAHWFAQLGCAHGPLVPAADFDQVGLLARAVMAGLGVAVVQRCLVEAELAAGRIAVALERPVNLSAATTCAAPRAGPRTRRWRRCASGCSPRRSPCSQPFQARSQSHWLLAQASTSAA